MHQIVAGEEKYSGKRYEPPPMISTLSFQQIAARKKWGQWKPRTSHKYSCRHKTHQGSGRTVKKLQFTLLYQYNGVWDIIQQQYFTAQPQPVKQQVCNGARMRNITKTLKTQLRSLSLWFNKNMPIVLPLI